MHTPSMAYGCRVKQLHLRFLFDLSFKPTTIIINKTYTAYFTEIIERNRLDLFSRTQRILF